MGQAHRRGFAAMVAALHESAAHILGVEPSALERRRDVDLFTGARMRSSRK
jgi:hypothetical protein